MIKFIVPLPHVVSTSCNTLVTQFGVVGRYTLPPMRYYKMLISHGDLFIECVVATTQIFDIYKPTLTESLTGNEYDKSQIRFSPISIKVIFPEYCDNFLFVPGCEYVNLFNDLKDLHNQYEFTQMPSRLTEGVNLNNRLVSLGEFISAMTTPMEEAYSPNIFVANNAKEIYKHSIMKTILTPMDIDLVTWVFATLDLSKTHIDENKYPYMLADNFVMINHRIDNITDILLSHPVIEKFIGTPNFVNYFEIEKFVDNTSAYTYNKLANDYDHNFNKPYLHLLPNNIMQFNNLIYSISYSHVVDLEVHIDRFGKDHLLSSSSWLGTDMYENQYVGIADALRTIQHNTMASARTSAVEIRLVKNWLDEIHINMLIDDVEFTHKYYIPLWLYNLSSPCLINYPILDEARKTFGYI